MIDTQFLASLAKFNLIIRKRVTSNYKGARKSIAQGKGMLFKDHRIYAPGDDFRAIDWRVYARTDDLMIKNYEEERNLAVHILVDSSLSMGFGNPKKFDYASMLGVGFAYLSLRNNDKFQFATFSDDIEIFQPRRGMSQLMAMVDYLNSLKLKGKTDILSVIQKYKKIIGSKSMIMLISDFLVDLDNIKEALYYLAGNEVTVIQVLDSREKSIEMEGDFKLKDSESDALLRTYVSPKLIEEYAEKLDKHTAAIRNECFTMGMNFFQVDNSMAIFDAFYSILK